jgi:non-heme chloroperoxidase
MDHYADDLAAVTAHLELEDAVHVGHSTGGGEVARYVARYGKGRVAKAVLVSAVPPLMLKTDKNPEGTPLSVFDGFRAQLAANRAQFFREVPMPFYGFNRPGAKVLEGVVDNWWRQGMMGAANAHYLGIKAFSETDQTEDLKAIDVPTLVTQSDDDQIVPFKDAVLLHAKLRVATGYLQPKSFQHIAGWPPDDRPDSTVTVSQDGPSNPIVTGSEEVNNCSAAITRPLHEQPYR